MLVLIGLVSTAAIWHKYQLYGHSASLDFFRQLTFDRCIQGGMLFPRYVPDTYFGIGSPLFHFYAPLPYYMAELFVVLGISVVSAIKATLVLTFILSGLTMYLFCRDFTGRLVSFTAGLAYMFAPYHLVDMIVRGAIGEHVAFAFIPLGAWGLSGMLLGKRPRRMIVGAIAIAALILTHNITAMLAFGAFALWWLILFLWTKDWKSGTWGGALLGAGLLLALFFWAPVMVEKDLTYAEESLTQGYFVYSDHFVYPFQLIHPSWGYGGSRKGIKGDDMSYQVGIPHLLFVLATLFVFVFSLYKKNRAAPLLLYGFVLFLGSAFFTLPFSDFMYRLIPLLTYVQFPWRFLVFVAFASSILAVSIGLLIRAIKSPYALPVTVALAGVLVVMFYGKYTKPAFQMFDGERQKFTFVTLDRAKSLDGKTGYLNAWEIGGLRYMRNIGEPCTSRDDYLPRTVDRYYKPEKQPDEMAVWLGEGNADLSWQHDGPVNLFAKVTTEEPGALEFKRFYFPGWVAYVNGEETSILPKPDEGTILVKVDPGISRVELKFESTDFRLFTGAISLLTLITLTLFGFGIFGKNWYTEPN